MTVFKHINPKHKGITTLVSNQIFMASKLISLGQLDLAIKELDKAFANLDAQKNLSDLELELAQQITRERLSLIFD